MKSYIRISTTVILGLMLSCSKSDDGPTAAPEVSYSQELKATFFVEGQSEPPQINWNGDVGKFGLQNTVKGISINKENGIISWDKTLPAGNHVVEIAAFNNAGSTSITVTIENLLKGMFRGELFPGVYAVGTQYTLQFNFEEDGNLSGFTIQENAEGDIEGPFEFFGNFTNEMNEIRGSFRYEEVAEPIPFAGTITNTQQKAVLTGRYFPEYVCESENCAPPTIFELELTGKE